MNTNIFKDSDGLMNNICYVTEYLRSIGVETIEVIPTKDGKKYLKSDRAYRMYLFIEDTVTYQKVTDRNVFKSSGKAFGQFQNYLAKFDASVLVETIPNFHHTPLRFEAFKKALAADVCGRAKDCKAEIDFVLSHADTYSKVVDGLANGTIPLRVTHNDTKLNNILMDEKTNEARAIVDLDTIMEGLPKEQMKEDLHDALIVSMAYKDPCVSWAWQCSSSRAWLFLSQTNSKMQSRQFRP